MAHGPYRFAGAALLPWPVIAAAELCFLPLLAYLIGRALLRERNRNFPMLVIVALLWGIDAWFLEALRRGYPALAAVRSPPASASCCCW